MKFRTRNKDRVKSGVHLNNVKNNLHTLQKTHRLTDRRNILTLFKVTAAVNFEQHVKKCTLVEKFIKYFGVEGGDICITSLNNEE